MARKAATLSGICLACALLVAVAARGSIAPTEKPSDGELTPSTALRCKPPHPGKTTRDYEVVFGRFGNRIRAHLLLRRVHRKGFARARIERESCIFEVAVIFLTRHTAHRIARKARKRGFAVRIMVS
jgi:hypothetical protein